MINKLPSFPIHFSGEVKYSDGAIPKSGTKLEAYINGECRNNKPHVLPGDGVYGLLLPISWNNLVVLGSPSDNGCNIIFVLDDKFISEPYNITNWDKSGQDSPIKYNLVFNRIDYIINELSNLSYNMSMVKDQLDQLEIW